MDYGAGGSEFQTLRNVPSADACCAGCGTTADCAYWVFRHSNGDCYLKRDQGATNFFASSGLSAGAKPAAGYVGCYNDDGSRRLPVRLASDPSMTTTKCRDLAASAGLSLYGTQYGAECYGGSDETRATSLGPSTGCNMGCAGASTETCGGGWANSVYRRSTVSGNKLGCYKKSYGRGVGVLPNACPSGTEQSGLLCYPPCQAGYTGVGPVCWQNCPSNFRDDGAFCAKPAAYGRGTGYALWDQWKCVRDNPQGCELNGWLYYPKCAAGFYAFGCCICSPLCPSGMTDIGVSCAKQSYGRTAGVPMICSSDLQQDAGLCYPKCNTGYDGIGPVCWQSASGGCPTAYPNSCGLFCTKSSETCTQVEKDIGLKTGYLAGSYAFLLACAGTTFATFGAAAACFGPALVTFGATYADNALYWTDNFEFC
ncbi:hypothetical protein HYH03_015465 [Edaphochlamys debaryana]|uniref:WSC domain-containing protein n=1 Tax=Edaphochlamys debaryana TaxID=47281 RepID=A0A835XJH2_9CHLO|nr:hypothetical protein HYH03_015465 [Edaphochlamys debaryana]|eukprot:KAG2485882.1 hypothetical protein HYH03_015465 [Edaphochlamys debaryana]